MKALENSLNDELDALTALLYMNRALCYEVFSQLRSVRITWDDEKMYLYFFYEGEISEEDHESAECIATQMIANFNYFLLEVEITRCDYPSPIPLIGMLAYHRYEPDINRGIEQESKHLREIVKENSAISLRVTIILNAIVGLIGRISSSLRSLQIKWENSTIYLSLYYDGEISERDRGLAQDAASQIASDLPSYHLDLAVIRWDFPEPIPTFDTETVYHRKESSTQPS